ncbi:caspase family protein [Ekhidna sp.]|uniref:caspase family protein n=1 Tax=Ekhidna sp. TaxID=2608089 RepID=UPI00329A1364
MSNYILAIGIDKYPNCTKLNNAARDINNMIDVLTESYDFEKSNITMLIDEKATLEGITNELENYLASQEENDNLLILYSGHGDFDELLQMGYILPYEATPYSKATYLPYSTLFSYIKAFKSHHILLISDSCYSGSVFTPYRKVETSKEKLDKIPSKWAITSGRLEPVSDGEPGKNSPFAEAIIKVLEENQSLLSVSELSNKVLSEVAEKVDQIPRGEPLQSFGHKGGEFIFSVKSSPKKTTKSKVSKESAERQELIDLIKAHYDLEGKIEEAENENKAGTIRRLEREKESLKNILNKELIKELEIHKNNISKESQKPDNLPKEYIQKSIEIQDIRKAKNKVVREQKYNDAAILRDKEKLLEKEIDGLLNYAELVDNLTLSGGSLYRDYFMCQFLIQTRSNIKFDKRDRIEAIFGRILFYDLSFRHGFISKYVYEDSRRKIVDILKKDLT